MATRSGGIAHLIDETHNATRRALGDLRRPDESTPGLGRITGARGGVRVRDVEPRGTWVVDAPQLLPASRYPVGSMDQVAEGLGVAGQEGGDLFAGPAGEQGWAIEIGAVGER